MPDEGASFGIWVAPILEPEFRYAGRMRIRLLLFGVLRELAGTPERETELSEGATVEDVVRVCEQLLPATAIWPSVATAVNEEYAARSRQLRDGDVVALLPPVSGGGCSVHSANHTSNKR